jgi:DNA-binding beta-propeller fold protein YncE
VTRFLGGALRGVVSRVIDTPGVRSFTNGIAVSRDGATLLLSNSNTVSHSIHEICVADGSPLRVVGSSVGDGPLQFHAPRQVWIAPDDFVFVSDRGNNRVQVLTPTLDFHAVFSVTKLNFPCGVCASADVVVVSQRAPCRIAVFSRRDGSLLRQFGRGGSGDGDVNNPLGLCFMRDGRDIAVADKDNHRVSVFSVDGTFIRHVGVGVLSRPGGVACSAFDELVVADVGNHRVAVFSASGELVKTFGRSNFHGVAVHGCTVFAQSFDRGCVVFE